MMNYLAATIRPDVLCAAHQCSRFLSNPKRSHEAADKCIGKHLKRTKDKGIIYDFYAAKGIEVFVDADFSGTWNMSDSDKMTSDLSRTGHVSTRWKTVQHSG